MIQPTIIEEKKALSTLQNNKGEVVGHDRIEEFRAGAVIRGSRLYKTQITI
jgi:hypothetical protein